MTPRCTQPPAGAAAAIAAACRAPLPRLETERLSLRAPDMGDLPAFSRIHAKSFATPVADPREAWIEFNYYTAGWLLHGHGLWTVTPRGEAPPLGFVLIGLEWEDAEPELGWMLLPEQRGRGYATEAARAALDWGRTVLGEGRIVSYIDADNAASQAVARRLGAVTDGARPPHDPGCEIWRHGRAN